VGNVIYRRRGCATSPSRTSNPVDIGPAPPQVYLDIFEILLSAGEVDGLLLMSSIWRDFIIDVIKELVKMCKQHDKLAAIRPAPVRHHGGGGAGPGCIASAVQISSEEGESV